MSQPPGTWAHAPPVAVTDADNQVINAIVRCLLIVTSSTNYFVYSVPHVAVQPNVRDYAHCSARVAALNKCRCTSRGGSETAREMKGASVRSIRHDAKTPHVVNEWRWSSDNRVRIFAACGVKENQPLRKLTASGGSAYISHTTPNSSLGGLKNTRFPQGCQSGRPLKLPVTSQTFSAALASPTDMLISSIGSAATCLIGL
jgi:hypothetical protein